MKVCQSDAEAKVSYATLLTKGVKQRLTEKQQFSDENLRELNRNERLNKKLKGLLKKSKNINGKINTKLKIQTALNEEIDAKFHLIEKQNKKLLAK